MVKSASNERDAIRKSALCAESTEVEAIPGGAPRICFAIPGVETPEARLGRF